MAGARPTSARDNSRPDELITPIMKKLEGLRAASVNHCIHAVPDKVRQVHREAFSPKLVSIGPFYHGKQRRDMKEQKWRYLDIFLDQSEERLKGCVEVIEKLEKRTRFCYSEKIDLNHNEFITMVLVDGAFMIELFLLYRFPESRAEDDVIFNEKTQWMIADVIRDMSLMENQLPYFVLEDLFNFRCETHSGELPSLLELAYNFFSFEGNLKAEKNKIFNSKVRNLLDAFRLWYLPTTQDGLDDGWKKTEEIPTALQLRAAGVKIRKSKTDAKLLISKGIINIDDWKGHDETLAKNDEALANLFNNFGKENRNIGYHDARRQLNAYYRSPCWNKLKVSLLRVQEEAIRLILGKDLEQVEG